MKYKYSEIQSVFHNREPWLNVLVFSYITKPLTFLVVNYTNINPNQISILSLMFGITSAIFIAMGRVELGVLLYCISYIFDAIDGKVARIKKTGKPYGSWFDVLIDRINLTLISTAIAFNYYNELGDVIMLVLNGFFLGLAFIGWESRYNIDIYSLNNGMKTSKELKPTSKYSKWTFKHGLDISPISLVEVFLFYLIISPILKIELIAIIFAIFMLILRLIMQQKFWYEISRKKE